MYPTNFNHARSIASLKNNAGYQSEVLQIDHSNLVGTGQQRGFLCYYFGSYFVWILREAMLTYTLAAICIASEATYM